MSDIVMVNGEGGEVVTSGGITSTLEYRPQEEGQTVSLEELLGGDIDVSPIELALDNLEDVKFDEKEFQEGVNASSYNCGIICALLNTGLSEKSVIEYIINLDTINCTKELEEIKAKNNIDVTKLQTMGTGRL